MIHDAFRPLVLVGCIVLGTSGDAHAQRNPLASASDGPTTQQLTTDRAAGAKAPTSASAPKAAPKAAQKAAQERPRQEPASREQAEARATIEERDRNRMHPGNPLELMGAFDGDNDGRAISPILKNGEARPAQVDTEELRERALAMYADRPAPLRTPPGSQHSSYPPIQPTRTAPVHTTREEQVPGHVGPLPWLVLAGGGALVWFLTRKKPATRRPAPRSNEMATLDLSETRTSGSSTANKVGGRTKSAA